MKERPLAYRDERERIRRALGECSRRWPHARLESHELDGSSDLTIDALWAEAQQRESLVLLTGGLHGIEGHLGAAMIALFVEEVAPRLDPRTTGLSLIYPVNPWGMQHGRRVNANGVDLNRNFIWDAAGTTSPDEVHDPNANPDYTRLAFLNPRHRVNTVSAGTLEMGLGLIRALMGHGATAVSRATLLGQYADPRGVYFGGHDGQAEKTWVAAFFERALREYKHVVILDLHSGYGPRWQMSLVTSALDREPAAETAKRIGYPRVVKATGEEFYAISGDMIDFAYRMRDARFADRKLFAGAMEFGTFGDSFPALLRSLRITILENQAFWHGASPRVRRWIDQEWLELYFPGEPRWWDKARADARLAFEGVLRAEGMLQ